MDYSETEEMKMIRETARKIVNDYDREYVKKHVEEKEFPDEFWQDLADNGFVGTMIEEEYGGAGMGMVEMSVILEELAREDPSFLLVMVPLAFLTIAPSEEFIYRNLIQKYLYDDFGEFQAIILTSAVFGVVHFGQYSTGTPTQTVLSLLLVFVLSTLLGLSYLRTENLLVPIFIHGAFNAIQFLTLYIEITGNPVV